MRYSVRHAEFKLQRERGRGIVGLVFLSSIHIRAFVAYVGMEIVPPRTNTASCMSVVASAVYSWWRHKSSRFLTQLALRLSRVLVLEASLLRYICI